MPRDSQPPANATTRFSSRVDNYVKYRPSYPAGVLETLRAECGLAKDSVVADIGAGTGILTELLLPAAARVMAVEPNREMRLAAENRLQYHSNYTSLVAAAEATTLSEHSVDIVTAAQAFHWFDRPRARHEFQRILKPNGWCVLIWNNRLPDATPFLRAYEEILKKFSTDYSAVDHRQMTDDVITDFYAPQKFALKTFPYRQVFNYESLEGRLLSSSYAPEKDHPQYSAMLKALRAAFDTHQENGQVSFEYVTQIYYGRL